MTAIDVVVQYYPALLGGLRVTFSICGIVWVIGLILGVPLGITRMRSVNAAVSIVSTFAQGMPVLCALFILHYPIQALLGVTIEPFWTAVMTFGFVHTLAVAGLVRQKVSDFPTQYVLAGRSLGLSESRLVTQVMLPLMLRDLIPGLLPLQNAILHASLFASLISVPEIFRVSQRIVSKEHLPVEVYTALGLFMFMISLCLVLLGEYLRRRLTRDVSQR